MAGYPHTRLTPEDIPYSVILKNKPTYDEEGERIAGEFNVDISDKEGRSRDWTEGFAKFEQSSIRINRLKVQLEEEERIRRELLQDMLHVLDVVDDDGTVKTLLEILERDGLATADRHDKVVRLQELTVKIRNKEAQMTFSRAREHYVAWSKCWRDLYDTFVEINEAAGKSRGSQTKILEYMDSLREKYTNTPTRSGFTSGRMHYSKRLRQKRIQRESVGDTIEYIWRRIKDVVMGVAKEIKKNTEKWFKTSRKIDQKLRSIEVQIDSLEESMQISGGDMLKEKFENPKLTRAGFETDVDEDKREIRIGIPKSRRQHYDDKMEAAESVQDQVREIKEKTKKLENKVKKLKDEADEALTVLDDDGQARSLLEILEENEKDLITIGEKVEKFADLTIRISSNKYIRTLSKVPDKSPNYEAVVEKLLVVLKQVNTTAMQNDELIAYIEMLIETNLKTKGRRDLGVMALGESLLYEFQFVQNIKKIWNTISKKISMVIKKMRGIHQQWNQINDELNRLMREVLPADIRSIKESKREWIFQDSKGTRVLNEQKLTEEKSKAKKYTIEDLGEEGQCPHCGYPLYVGDTAYEMPDGSESGFCCKECVEGYLKEE